MTVEVPSPSVATPMFLTLNGRRLFALQIAPTGACVGSVLYLPPFAEEMNRCRNHAAAMARRLAAQGQRVLLLDHFGTGESEGRIPEAGWDHWLADATAAAQWLQAQQGGPLTLWGIRTGALLAADVATSQPELALARLLFWQPVLDGKLFLNQYLRLRIASQLVHDADRETTETIRARLAAGEDIEVAGYPLSGRMAESLSARKMAPAPGLARQPIDWIEVVAKADQPLGVPARRLVDSLTAAGAAVQTRTVVCPQIWQTYEREDAPELQAATLALWAGAAA